MGKTSAKSKNAYAARAYDSIHLLLPKGDRDKLKEHAIKKDNGSVNGFINRAIKEAIDRDNQLNDFRGC